MQDFILLSLDKLIIMMIIIINNLKSSYHHPHALNRLVVESMTGLFMTDHPLSNWSRVSLTFSVPTIYLCHVTDTVLRSDEDLASSPPPPQIETSSSFARQASTPFALQQKYSMVLDSSASHISAT